MKVLPEMPDRIKRLEELAYNLWWSWHPEARSLFEALDHPLWNKTHHNPVKILRNVSSERLKLVSRDPAFLRRYDGVLKSYDQHLSEKETWYGKRFPDLVDQPIAYFSAEFGLHNSLPIYSGGLGLLAGDHCKEAGEMGLPLIGIGFLYPQGYFHQRIEADGWQKAGYRPLDVDQVGIKPLLSPGSKKRLVEVPVGQRTVYITVWQVQVGRVRLYLMDTDVEENAPWDRELSARLYGGDQELRIRQEIVLGIGGVRLLRALDIHPTIWHANEGHSAFLMLERVREGVSSGKSFEAATESVRKTTIFTTHTPVPAGHDAFPPHLIEKYFSSYRNDLGLDQEKFWALGRHQEGWGEGFNMSVLAFHLSGAHNAVSRMHEQVTRQMWQSLWPDVDQKALPITSITNGIHVPTWVAPEIDRLYRKYIAPDWVSLHDDGFIWQRVYDIPDPLLWETRQQVKRKLFAIIRERARTSWAQDRADPAQILAAGTLLNPEALTIGFARRFAGYKRATLIFRDLERLKRLLGDRWQPVQLIFAGKAHPADEIGKRHLQQIYRLAKDSGMAGHVAFVEDYDMHIAHFLVQGVDLWLNTPRAPHEASGTSGMKAGLNGVPQLGILDGWWCEGYNGSNGWAFGTPADLSQEVASEEAQDETDAEGLYRVLEKEVVPLYYSRDTDGIPRGWMQTVKESIRTTAPTFSARRMVKEYAERLYAPAAIEENNKKSHVKGRALKS